MKNKALSLFITIIVGMAIVGLAGLHAQRKTETIRPVLPSPTDIQQMLNELEPENPLIADGIIGAKTLEKWERVYCNESARVHFSE